jgi:oxygen-independent coproporphyrinogen-3 oxidase
MGIARLWKVKQPAQYLQQVAAGSACGGEKQLSDSEIPLEFMLNALRLQDGFDLDLYQQHTGLTAETIQKPLQIAQEKELLKVHNNYVRPTSLGQQYLNDLISLFINEHNP